MRILIFFAVVVVSVLLVTSSTCSTTRIRQTSDEKLIEANEESSTTVKGNASLAKNNGETDSNGARTVAESALETNSNSTSETVTNGATIQSVNARSPSEGPKMETTPMKVLPPDGQVFLGGEEPYAYIPTYSPKVRNLPIVPLAD
jgi:hypothetical protein